MLEAADDFVRSVDATGKLLNEAAFAQMRWSFWTQASSSLAEEAQQRAQETRKRADDAVDEVTGLMARVRLLFGPDANATRHADKTHQNVLEGQGEIYGFLTHYIGDESDSESDELAEDDERDYTDEERERLLDSVNSKRESASAALDDFSRAARRAISGRTFAGYRRQAATAED